MKLEIGDVTLHETGDGSNLFGLSGGIERRVDESAPIGAADIVTYFRGNKATEFSFRIDRPFSSAEEALVEWFRLEATLPGDSPLVLTTSTHVITIAGNLLQVGQPRLVGLRVWWEFRFRGGLPVVTDLEGGGDVSQTDRTYQGLSLSSAGTTQLSLSSLHRETTVKIAAGAGSGSYTQKIVLPATAARKKGDQAHIRAELPASANPTLQFRNASDSGTLLETLTGLGGGAVTYLLEFVFDGSAWLKLSARSEP